jgi:phenylalanyl-tRNA synthetase beta chain
MAMRGAGAGRISDASDLVRHGLVTDEGEDRHRLTELGALAGGLNWQQGGPAWLHATQRGTISLADSAAIGVAGQLARRVAEKFKLRQEVFLAEIELEPVYAAYRAAKESRRYVPIPRFPAVERDFSLLLADGSAFSEVAAAIRSLHIPEVSSIEAADLFRGKNVPAGKYSLMIRVLFQSKEATLTDAQINDFSSRIIAALETNLGAQLRSS